MINNNNKRSFVTYHYRTFSEFYEFFERLNKQFPLIGLDLKYSRQTEDKILAQRRVSEINDFLQNLFRLTNEVVQVKFLTLKKDYLFCLLYSLIW